MRTRAQSRSSHSASAPSRSWPRSRWPCPGCAEQIETSRASRPRTGHSAACLRRGRHCAPSSASARRAARQAARFGPAPKIIPKCAESHETPTFRAPIPLQLPPRREKSRDKHMQRSSTWPTWSPGCLSAAPEARAGPVIFFKKNGS